MNEWREGEREVCSLQGKKKVSAGPNATEV